MPKDPRSLRCALLVLIGAFNGGFFGGLAGLLIGGPVVGVLGAGVGGCIGAAVGALICWFVDILLAPGFAIPTIKATLTAKPNPAKVGDPCEITLAFQYSGNTDNALCEITGQIVTTGIPGVSPPPPAPYLSNAQYWGSAFPVFATTWAKPSDGEPVIGTVVLTAKKGGQTVVVADTVQIKVVVLP